MNTEMVAVRDGKKIACFRYPVDGEPVCRMLFLHGSTFNSRRYANIAKACAKVGCETVLIDWRGHGQSDGESGHCNYPGQLEDDISDLLTHYKAEQALPTLLGGHSAGSVICLKYIERYGQDEIVGFYSISPAFGNILEATRYDFQTAKRQFFLNFWRKKPTLNPPPEKAKQHIPSFKSKRFWLAILLPFLRNQKVLVFPGNGKMAKLEGRIMEYSANMVLATSTEKYITQFRQIEKPTILICGENDEMIQPEFLQTVYHWHLAPTLDKSIEIVPRLNHTNIVNGASKILPQWIAKRWPYHSPAKETPIKETPLSQSAETPNNNTVPNIPKITEPTTQTPIMAEARQCS